MATATATTACLVGSTGLVVRQYACHPMQTHRIDNIVLGFPDPLRLSSQSQYIFRLRIHAQNNHSTNINIPTTSRLKPKSTLPFHPRHHNLAHPIPASRNNLLLCTRHHRPRGRWFRQPAKDRLRPQHRSRTSRQESRCEGIHPDIHVWRIDDLDFSLHENEGSAGRGGEGDWVRAYDHPQTRVAGG